MMELRGFKPDVIIAIGGGSPMDAAKLMWLMYEQPDIKFEEVAARFMVRSFCCIHAGCCCLLCLWQPGIMAFVAAMVVKAFMLLHHLCTRHSHKTSSAYYSPLLCCVALSCLLLLLSAGHPQAHQRHPPAGQAGAVCGHPHHLWHWQRGHTLRRGD
jgi:hypothetical protein